MTQQFSSQLALIWWPCHIYAVTVSAYHDAFFAVLDRRPMQ